MKEYRCVKLGGKIAPKSCHILNGRKTYCKDFIEIELDEEERKNKIDKIFEDFHY